MNIKTFIITFAFITTIAYIAQTIQLPIRSSPQCMVLQQAQDVLSVQVQFPKISKKNEGQNFSVKVHELLTGQIISQSDVQENSLFRSNFNLQPQKLYSICFQFNAKKRWTKDNEQIWINYLAKEDFDSMIGQISIPEQLQGEENLKKIYQVSQQASKLNQKIRSNQAVQRKLEQDLTVLNLHKNERIVSLTLIQCLVIVLSGVYQIFALRRFLIQKGLY